MKLFADIIIRRQIRKQTQKDTPENSEKYFPKTGSWRKNHFFPTMSRLNILGKQEGANWYEIFGHFQNMREAGI